MSYTLIRDLPQPQQPQQPQQPKPTPTAPPPSGGAPVDEANEIIPRLWIGDKNAAMNEKWLRENGIDCVFNCTKDLPFASASVIPVRNQYRVPVDDNLQPAEINNMTTWAPEIAFRILQEYKQGRRILVHCYAGRQRSATAVAFFLLLHTGRPLIQVMHLILSRRAVAFRPRVNFAESLRSFEKTVQTQLLFAERGDRYLHMPTATK